MKPTVGGMPVSPSRATASTSAAKGARRPMPAIASMRSSPERCVSTMTAKNAASVIAA